MQQDQVKYLRVIVDKNLNWKAHIAKVRNKCFAGLSFLWRNMKYLPTGSKKLMYNSFIMPYLDYCQVLYNPCSRVLTGAYSELCNEVDYRETTSH